MIEILEMRDGEIRDLLERVGFAHLACSRDDQPYIIPIYYAYDGTDIFVYTTAGLKSETMERNPKVCVQVEEIRADGAWQSVVVIGEAQQITDRAEREKVVDLVRSTNPTLLPALAIKWSNDWMRKNVEVVYRIKVNEATGRFTSDIRIASAAARPGFCKAPPVL